VARDPSRRPSSAPPPAPPRPGPAPAEAMRALKGQLDARRTESKRLVAEAERAASHGDRVGAAEAYRKAARLSPNDAAIAAAHAAARQAIGVVAAEAHARQAELEERFGHWAEAARTWRLVADARPTEALAHGRLAAALLRAGGDADQAVQAAARAAELEPGEPRHRALLAEAQARQSQRGGEPRS
jgi:Flp pilus assembly protein TadD